MVSKRVITYLYTGNIGYILAYEPLAKFLLTCWDIQVPLSNILGCDITKEILFEDKHGSF